MAFATDEQSVQGGSPIELFKFTGTYNTYRLTNWGRPITNSDGTYSADFAVSRSDVEEGTQEEDEISLDVELDVSHPMVAEYAINDPPPGLLLQVYRAHPSDLDDTFLQWEGEVVSWSLTGRVAKLRAPSVFSFLFNDPLPWPKWQAPCNHVLGDARCGIDLSDPSYTADTTISSINGTQVVVAANTFAAGELDGGQIIAASERRLITGSSAGTTLTISSAFSPAVVPTDAVTLRVGCDHALNGDCVNRFSNAANFFGTPYTPGRNPFTSRL